MAETTGIAWTDSTFNPWIGCTKVGPGCDHCYAEHLMDARMHKVQWGAGQPRRRTSADNWDLPGRWQRQAVAFQAEHGRRRRVFCASLADWLDNEAPIPWLVDLLEVIRTTPDLDWLLLSKRIGNWSSRISECIGFLDEQTPAAYPLPLRHWLCHWLDGDEAPRNVWIGSTVVNQTEADRDVPKLLRTPAAVRFLSIEPMLGPVDLQRWLWTCCGDMQPGNDHGLLGQEPDRCCGRPDASDALHWVICGGESGAHARPMHPDWARSLRDQCAAAGVAFHFKQWGQWAPGSRDFREGSAVALDGRVAADGYDRATYPPGAEGGGWTMVHRAGKAAGRLLDGVEHNGFPA